MIKFENTEVLGWEHAIRGMRNPLNSWDKSDSIKCYANANCPGICRDNVSGICIGTNDMKLIKRLRKAGTDHRKYLRMIVVYVDITAPLYWWSEYDTYKVGTVANSCSKMHKLHAKRFEREDFSIEHIHNFKEQHWMVCMDNVISSLNVAREKFLETKDKKYWWQMIQLLPSSYNQKRTVMMNYEVLNNIYKSRKNHKLDEWSVGFMQWIESLPYAKDLITENN